MVGFDLLAGFISTSVATLIGVGVGFWNDRRIEEANQHQRAIQHLKSIEQELTRNRETINNSVDVINELQDDGGGDSSHYAIDVLSTNAWNAAINDQVIESIDGGLYRDLNEVYYRAQTINEMIHRLRTESIHPSIGDIEGEGIFQREIWTITVTYWNEDRETVQEAELATVIKNKCNSLGIRIDGISGDIEESINELQEKKEEAERFSFKQITKSRE